MTYRDFISKYQKLGYEKEAIIFLICEALNITRSSLLLILNDDIKHSVLDKYIIGLDKYLPVQYIIGYTYFYKYKFYVNKDVLIPRFDTEVLVEEAINQLKNSNYKQIVDIGTGSGAIAISIKKEIPFLDVDAIDISLSALEVAKKNADFNNVEINFINNDLLSNINKAYDMIISNPPYISFDEEVMDLVKDNEPHLALYSSNNGLYHYNEILKQSKKNLKKGGLILFEIPSNKDDDIVSLVKKYYNNYRILKDYNQLSRVIIIKGE